MDDSWSSFVSQVGDEKVPYFGLDLHVFKKN